MMDRPMINSFGRSSERRKHERSKQVRACSIKSLTGQWACNGYILDLSQGGAGLDVLKECPIKESVTVYLLNEDGKEFNRTGTVVWSKKREFPNVGSLIGLQFLN